MACGTIAIWRLMATLQIVFHILETSLQVHSAVIYLTTLPPRGGGDIDPNMVACVLLGVITFSSCVTNITSAWWTNRSMDFTGRRSGGWMCAVLHLLQLGPVWRYFKLMIIGEYKDLDELSQLRILQVSLQNPVYIIVQGSMLMVAPSRYFTELSIGVTVSFMSLVYSFTCCSYTASSTLTFVKHFEGQQNSKWECSRTVCSLLRLISRVIRHSFMLASRLLAMILLAHAWKTWVVILVACHLTLFYLIYIIWSLVYNAQHKPETSIIKQVPDILLCGYTEVFDFVGMLHHSSKSMSIYYAAILIENSVMGVAWYFTGRHGAFDDALLVLVFTFFILGVIACVLSEAVLCKSDSPCLDEESEAKEENNNLDSGESNASFIPELKIIPPKQTSDAIGQLDFDLDLNDILVASSKFNPKVTEEVTFMISNEVGSYEPRVDYTACKDRETSNEAQTSSDSGFVSRLFDNSVSFENDSEGYSRGVTTPSVDSSMLGGTCTTEPKETPRSTNTETCINHSLLNDSTEEFGPKVVTTSPTTIAQIPVIINSKGNSTRGRLLSRCKTSEAVHKTPMSWTANDTWGWDSDTTKTSSRHRRPRGRRKHGEVFTRSRSMPNRQRNLPARARLYHSGTSESSSDQSAARRHRRGRALRARSELLFYASSSSESTSDSFFESYMRRNDSRGLSNSTSTDSQSLDDSDYGLALTWPPGRKCSIVNIYQLPMEQISAKEHVLEWLKGVKETDSPPQSPDRQQTQSVITTGVRDNCDAIPSHHRFNSFRDVKISYIDTCYDVARMSDSDVVRGRREVRGFPRGRTMSEGGMKRKPSFLKLCGLPLARSGKTKWFDRKIIRRFSISGSKPKRKTIIVNKEATSVNELRMLGLESSV